MNHSHRRSTTPLTAIAVALIALSAVAPVAGQVTTAPPLGPAPQLVLPRVDTTRLANGLTILVAQNAEVPLVAARLILPGGARSDGERPGIATFTATMLDEGAGDRTGLELAAAADFLGARLTTGAGWDNVTVALNGPKRTFSAAMSLLADVVLHPTFASADLARERALRLSSFAAARDNPGQVASQVFYRNVFPATHPLHRNLNGDSLSIGGLDSATVRQFWTLTADPAHATLILTGDVTMAEARRWAQDALGRWSGPSRPLAAPAAGTVPPPQRQPTRVILVDKPGAAQSVILIGAPGVSRTDPDFPALAVMNTLLGGSFSSRLNDILREQRGYSYGANSGFRFGPVPGPFIAQSAVRTDVTDSSLAIFMREFARIRSTAATPDELDRSRNYQVLGALSDYETAGQVAGAIDQALLYGQPLQATTRELDAMARVTAGDLLRVARRHLDPAQMTIVVVGDLALIRPGISRLQLGPIEVQEY